MKRIGIRLPLHLWQELKEIAEYKGYSLNSLILQAINEFLKE